MTHSACRYNRIVKGPNIALAALGLSIALLSGCKKDIQNNEAVQQGVMNYLAKRQDLLAMDVSVKAVQYRQNEATATVHFQAKGNSAPGSGMDMPYVMERKGDQWVVKGRASGDAHGSQGMGMPQVPADAGSNGAMPQTMPPGHPTVGSGAGAMPAGQLPPGHPAIKTDKKPGPTQ
jgi:hypothetical protein